MAIRRVNLTEQDDRFVEGQVASGRYKDASEVVRAGLRLLEQRAREDEEKLESLRALATEAFDALNRGEGVTLDGDRELAAFLGEVGRRSDRNPHGQSPIGRAANP